MIILQKYYIAAYLDLQTLLGRKIDTSPFIF